MDVIQQSIYRPPFAEGWLQEDTVYALYAQITPEMVSRGYYSGRFSVLRQQPAQVVWVRPGLGNWKDLAAKVAEEVQS